MYKWWLGYQFNNGPHWNGSLHMWQNLNDKWKPTVADWLVGWSWTAEPGSWEVTWWQWIIRMSWLTSDDGSTELYPSASSAKHTWIHGLMFSQLGQQSTSPTGNVMTNRELGMFTSWQSMGHNLKWLTIIELRLNVFSGHLVFTSPPWRKCVATNGSPDDVHEWRPFLGCPYPKLKKLQHLYGWRIHGANGYKQCGIGHS